MTHLLRALWHWVEVHTGTVNESGPYYGFFSGFGSDLQEVAILGGLVTIARHVNCHQKGCWRIAHRSTAAGDRVCRRHHPDGHLTAEHIHERHHAARSQG